MRINIIDYTKKDNNSCPSQFLRKDVIDTILIHSSDCYLNKALENYFNPDKRIGVHFCIDRDGSIYKIIPTGRAAESTGITSWDNRSIAVELINFRKIKNARCLTLAQEESLDRLLCNLFSGFKIDNLLGHREVRSNVADPYQVNMNELRAKYGMKK